MIPRPDQHNTVSPSEADLLAGHTMSHHYSGPNVGFPHGDARLDLTDLYAFPKPGCTDKSILIMNVHPSVTLLSQKPTRPDAFAPGAVYEFRIDTNQDSIADVAYRVIVSELMNGVQRATLRRAEGSQANEIGDSGTILIDGALISWGHEPYVTEAGEYRFFAGWRSDPFFFDPLGAINGFTFDGNDFFTDKDVCSIVLELPNAALGPNAVGLWARTVDRADGKWVQADRGGRPSQAIFLAGEQMETYLAAEPADDDQFVGAFAHSLEHTGGYSPEHALQVARMLLPDVLRFDPKRPATYPGNGRTLTDDALDGFLAIITNGRVLTDKVGPHQDLLSDFPYLGLPHNLTR
jgi:hypothetical protein